MVDCDFLLVLVNFRYLYAIFEFTNVYGALRVPDDEPSRVLD